MQKKTRAEAGIIGQVNHNATAGGYSPLSQWQINDILSLYPDISTAA